MSTANIDNFIKFVEELRDSFNPKISADMSKEAQQKEINQLKNAYQKQYNKNKFSKAEVVEQLKNTNKDKLKDFFE